LLHRSTNTDSSRNASFGRKRDSSGDQKKLKGYEKGNRGRKPPPKKTKATTTTTTTFQAQKRSFTCSEAESAKHQQHALLLDLNHGIDQ